MPVSSVEKPPSVAARIDERKTAGKRIRRLIFLIVVVSVGVHVMAGVGAGIWVVARYLAQPKAQFVTSKEVKLPVEDRQHRLQLDEVASLSARPVYNNRIQSLRPSRLALPQLPKVPLETMTPLDTEALVSNQIDGMGKYGDGAGGAGVGFFGGPGASGSGLLAGALYDLKKTSGGESVKMDRGRYYDLINRVARTNNSSTILDGFYRAPDTLYMPQLAIPVIKANEAPKQFKVEDKIKPAYWLAVYRGRAVAPESGTYKFLGFADDVLLVKINGRLVFDGSLGNASRLHGKEGVSFTLEKGAACDIEIIVGECPGGYFSAWLQIQKQGDGSAPYWFRMHDKAVTYKKGGGDGTQKMPSSDANGPVWWPSSKARAVPTGL